MAVRRPSYAWSQHLDVANRPESELSDRALLGLDYAERLAQESPIRAAMNLPRYQPPYLPLAMADLAEEEGVPVSMIGRRIAAARRELFGEISDAAIFKRAQRAKQQPRRPRRRCESAGCRDPLPRGAPNKRRYCDAHRSPAARARRHRQRAAN